MSGPTRRSEYIEVLSALAVLVGLMALAGLLEAMFEAERARTHETEAVQ